ncbi:major facilitator superfamily domain-containing protein [Chaetomium fimeti]|uniref:Major facilitator superfamily domain-containing protein n=1 Tax=Chaetomium fimeti TaxID=1854472 RepID=A0AAE0HBX3_9PEZI|nr:major facilitator superfamily domain-containing protein [Chaetomium fimeti]
MSEKSNYDHHGGGLTSLVESAQASHESINVKPPPPADRGKDAYLFLASCCVLEAVAWGLPFTYGVFNDYYNTHGPFDGSDNLAIVGTCSLGMMYLGLPLVFAFVQAYKKHIRILCAVSIIIMGVALALSSFATTVTHLILTQGILYGLGGSISCSTCVILLSDWYDKRKGIAFGIMLGGTGLGGTIVPIVTERLLQTFDFRTTLRVLAVAVVVLPSSFVYYMKPRVEPDPRISLRSQVGMRFMKTGAFVALQLANTVQGLGFFLPTLYLPMYARSIGASQSVGALTVVVYNIVSVVGCVLMGFIIDRWHVTTCCLACAVGSSISIFLLWGFSGSVAPLFVFCVTYGIFAGAWVSAWSGMVKVVQRSEPTADTSTVLAWLSAGRGIGNVISGPLSEALLRVDHWKGTLPYGYGSGYGILIVFTGITAALSGSCVIGRRLGYFK